ncbi:MAG: FAD binding domain-containing protein [Acidimicrobiia bacterium]|nr:FAD binding domain-containing protein [Acidimicrobiia bacterium]
MEIVRPDNLVGALDALASHPDALVLAGGTDAMVLVNAGILRPEYVISLRHVEELKAWNAGFIGAGVTYSRLEESDIVALAELSRTVGSPQIRAAGTLGGNLGTASPAGDALPFLAAVDATVELVSKQGARTLAWDEFLIGPKQSALGPDEIILGARLPDEMPGKTAFAKIGVRQAMVISIASVCVTRNEAGATTVALGAVGPTVLRARRAEMMMSAERAPDEAAMDEFQRLVSEESRPITDHRSTAEYRKMAVGVLARRALERCLV